MLYQEEKTVSWAWWVQPEGDSSHWLQVLFVRCFENIPLMLEPDTPSPVLRFSCYPSSPPPHGFPLLSDLSPPAGLSKFWGEMSQALGRGTHWARLLPTCATEKALSISKPFSNLLSPGQCDSSRGW